jgi:uncharacterized protein YijF (DUF1287 family)
VLIILEVTHSKNEWVCTDVIWRALENAWIKLKKLMDEDIKNNKSKKMATLRYSYFW